LIRFGEIKDLGSILTKLQKGAEVGFPDTEPFGTIAPGVFEIRVTESVLKGVGR
jgi:hypothetical protein